MNITFSLIILFTLGTIYGYGYSDDSDSGHHFPKNDHLRFLRDLNSALGFEKFTKKVGEYFQTQIHQAQSYSWRKFKLDWNELQVNRSITRFLVFLHKMAWVAITQTSLKIIQTFNDSNEFFLRYMKKKCDIYIGEDAGLHPWNIMMERNQQNISFLVFVYGLAFSLVLIRFLSSWNFMMYIASSFLLYSYGGPRMLFRSLLIVTSFFWFMFDMVLQYPVQTAFVIIALYVLSYLWRFLPTHRRSNSSVSYRDYQDFAASVPVNTRATHSRNDDRWNSGDSHQRDFRLLTNRIDGMERKTEMLSERLQRLSQAFDRFQKYSDDDDGNEAEIDE